MNLLFAHKQYMDMTPRLAIKLMLDLVSSGQLSVSGAKSGVRGVRFYPRKKQLFQSLVYVRGRRL